jgi:murein DD-endopeptidase MepM/ murein hydrolase activator NlpD
MKSRKKFGNFSFSGKGYYIALILCAVAIGISGYLYYRSVNQQDTQLQTPTDSADVLQDNQDDVPVVSTQPGDTSTKPTVPSGPIKTGAPLTGETIYDYAMDVLSYNETTRDWRVHNGIDIAAEAGTTVCAAADGTVYTTYVDDTMGTTVVIRHQDGYVTTYSSLDSELLVQPGATVTLGQAIGTVGNTAMLENALGDHLHFSVTCYDKPVDPVLFLSLE